MKTGDKVQLIGVPPNLPDDDLNTRRLFEKCMGQSFVVMGMESVEGVPYPLVRLDVGHVLGEEPWRHTIWVEPEYLRCE